MALEDLNDLFGAVDGFVEDSIEYGTLAVSAVAANVAFTAGSNYLLTHYAPTAPAWVKSWGVPAAGVLLGGALPSLVGMAKPSMRSSNIVKGLSIGLMSAGVMMAIRNHTALPLAGLGAPEDEALLGLGEDLYQKYLGGMNGATTSIEESVNGLGAATATIEESVGGLNNWQVENVNGISSTFN